MTEQARPRSVAVLTEVAALDKALDYLVPDGFNGPVDIGSRVRVDLHGRSVRGWVLGAGSQDGVELKALTSSLGIGPPQSVVELCEWAAWRWYSTPTRFLSFASPDRLVRSLPRRPPGPSIEVPDSVLGRLGSEHAQGASACLLRIGPATDPFDLVLGFLAGLGNALATKSALVLVPSVGYAQRLTARLGRRGIPAINESESWESARAGWPVIVGTRGGVFAPCPDLAGVLVLDAEDSRFIAEGAPTYATPVLALERARSASAPLLAVAAVPTAELCALLPFIPTPPGIERAGWPTVSVADRREEDPRNGLLTAHLVDELRAALRAHPSGIAAACVVNRTGRARLLACGRCEQIARCTSCEAAMVLDDDLVCPRCATHRPVVCQGCGATKLKLLRLGTAQLAVELGALLGVAVAELTAASAQPDPGTRVVVGTEAVLHRIRRTSLVALLDLDHHLLAPRAGAEQESLSLIARAGRLVGPRGEPDSGLVLLQTRNATHPVVEAAQAGDPSRVLEADQSLRAQLGLAPSRAYGLIKGEGAETFAHGLEGLGIEIASLGEHRLVVSAPDHQMLCDALAAAVRPKQRVVVSVDPVTF